MVLHKNFYQNKYDYRTQWLNFREDLYYRIDVITIGLPPLRERGDEILLLANYFLRKFNDEYKKVRRFSASAVNCLRTYEWPGNVRELQNRLQRAIIMSDEAVIEPGDLGCVTDAPAVPESEQPVFTLREAGDRVERELIAVAIDRHNGSIVKAAEELGVSRPTRYDLLKKHRLR